MSENYSMDHYIGDLRKIAAKTSDEREIFDLVGPLAQRLSAEGSWIEDRFYHPDSQAGYSAFLLHEEPDQSLAVMALAWAPGRGVGPHDHGTWAVVVGVEGVEENVRYKRLDDGADPDYAELEIKSKMNAGPGELVLIKKGGIHAVHNHSDKVTLSLHTYGLNFNKTNRSKFDVEARTAREFKVPME